MVHLRATQKVLRHLPGPFPSESPSDAALGDWYVKRFVVDRIPLLLLLSSTSLLAIVLRARDLRGLPERLPGLVEARLHRLGVPTELAEAEVSAMTPVVVSKTADRSVLGVLVDFGKLIPHILPDIWNEADFGAIEARLADTPCLVGRGYDDAIFPCDKAPDLLRTRWGG